MQSIGRCTLAENHHQHDENDKQEDDEEHESNVEDDEQQLDNAHNEPMNYTEMVELRRYRR